MFQSDAVVVVDVNLELLERLFSTEGIFCRQNDSYRALFVLHESAFVSFFNAREKESERERENDDHPS